MPQVVYTLKDVVAAISRSNKLLEQLVTITSGVLHVIVVSPNAPPQYTGPDEVNDAVVGQTYAMQGFDPDGDPLTWSIDPSVLATCSAAGVLTWTGAGEGDITYHIDDGKP